VTRRKWNRVKTKRSRCYETIRRPLPRPLRGRHQQVRWPTTKTHTTDSVASCSHFRCSRPSNHELCRSLSSAVPSPTVAPLHHFPLNDFSAKCSRTGSRQCDNCNRKFYKYVCMTTYQPDTTILTPILTLILLLNSTQ